MMRLLVCAGVVALASADGAQTISRRENVDVFSLQQLVNNQQSQIASLNTVLDDMRANAAMYRGAQETIGAVTSAVMSTSESMAIKATELTGSVTTLEGQMESIQSDVSTQLAASGVILNSQMAAFEATAAAQADDLANMTTTAITAMNISLIATTASLNTAMNGKAPARTHAWLGSSSTGRNGGWHWVIFNRPRLDTLAPYAQRHSNQQRFVALVAGVFNINFFTMNNSCGWARGQVRFNDNTVMDPHLHTAASWWKNVYLDYNVKASAGHWVGVYVESGCGHTALHSSAHHNNVEFTYMGKWN